MRDSDLRECLKRIDHKGYPAYKDTKGKYQFADYILSIDHVQGDPFAAPSKVSVLVDLQPFINNPASFRNVFRKQCSCHQFTVKLRMPLLPKKEGIHICIYLEERRIYRLFRNPAGILR